MMYKKPQAGPQVHVGKDGWLFLVDGSNSVLDLYKEQSSFDANLAEQWVQLLERRSDRLQARGIEYLHVAAPEKLTLLHSHYDGVIDNPEGSPITQLATHHGARIPCFLNIVPYLMRNIDKYTVYWKTDTHWSAWGAFLAYQQVCARLGLTANKEILSYPYSEADIAMDLGAKMHPPVQERIRFYQLERKSRRVYANSMVRYKEVNGFRNDGNLHVGSNVIFRNDSPDAADKTVVLFGDSFSEYRNHLLTGMLAETVRELHFVWSANIDDEYVRRVRPDIVITELAERFMTRVPTDEFNTDAVALERVEAHKRQKNESPENRNSFTKRQTLVESETRELTASVLVQDVDMATPTSTHSSPVELVEAHGVSLYFNGQRMLARAPCGEVIDRRSVAPEREAWIANEEYRNLPGTSFLLGDSPGAHRYTHWMLDVLPRLGYLQQAGIALGSIKHFLVRELSEDFQIETLEQLGIPRHKIVETVGDQYLRCERLLHLPLQHAGNTSMHSCVPAWLRETFQPTTAQSGRKVYLCQPERAKHGVSNEKALLPILEAAGFECLSIENMTAQDMAELLSRLDVLASAHGEALTNMVFCQPGTRVIELFGQQIDPVYRALAHVCGHAYHAIMSGSAGLVDLALLDTPASPSPVHVYGQNPLQPGPVDPELLQQMLSLVECQGEQQAA